MAVFYVLSNELSNLIQILTVKHSYSLGSGGRHSISAFVQGNLFKKMKLYLVGLCMIFLLTTVTGKIIHDAFCKKKKKKKKNNNNNNNNYLENQRKIFFIFKRNIITQDRH